MGWGELAFKWMGGKDNKDTGNELHETTSWGIGSVTSWSSNLFSWSCKLVVSPQTGSVRKHRSFPMVTTMTSKNSSLAAMRRPSKRFLSVVHAAATPNLPCAVFRVVIYHVLLLAVYFPYFWNSQSRLSSGHTWRVLSHRDMQWKWKACFNARVSVMGVMCKDRCHTLQIPQATVHSSLVDDAWFA